MLGLWMRSSCSCARPMVQTQSRPAHKDCNTTQGRRSACSPLFDFSFEHRHCTIFPSHRGWDVSRQQASIESHWLRRTHTNDQIPAAQSMSVQRTQRRQARGTALGALGRRRTSKLPPCPAPTAPHSTCSAGRAWARTTGF